MDNCPVCGRRIRDDDMTGCEANDGQRWCVVHLCRTASQRKRARQKYNRAVKQALKAR